MHLNDVTVVLPTKNETQNIERFLASLPPQVKLIVVDASTDGTPARIAALRPQQTCVIRNAAQVAQARQIGAEAARTPWLLFSDADVVFAPGYFERLTLIGAADVIYGPKLSQTQYTHYYRIFAGGQQLLGRIGIPAVTGSNLAVKRAALQAIGGFDTKLPCNEDSELGWRLARGGFKVVFSSDLVVYACDHRRLKQGTLRKCAHSVARCTLLYTNLMPKRWRYHDWGYWSAHR